MSPEEIKQAVGQRYSQVADTPSGKFNFPVGRKFAESVGYPASVLGNLPEGLYESFTGANNPQTEVELHEGEKLLDLGCGAGLDLYFYHRKRAEKVSLFGLDISYSMLKKAARNLSECGVKKFNPVQGCSDRMPLSDGSFDIVASNGIYNLSPDKRAVAREVCRVLRPGGRTVLSEIVLKAPLETEIRKNIDDWFRCIGGALTKPEFLGLLKSEGFNKIQVVREGRNARTGHSLAVFVNIIAYKPNA